MASAASARGEKTSPEYGLSRLSLNVILVAVLKSDLADFHLIPWWAACDSSDLYAFFSLVPSLFSDLAAFLNLASSKSSSSAFGSSL